MEKISLKDIKLIPDINSIERLDITDDEYFSKKYAGCVSNSRLKLINPAEGGSPQLYLNPPKFTSTSLSLGSKVHEQLLLGDFYDDAPKMGRPSAKLGDCLDEIIRLRNKGIGGYKAFEMASNKANYYAGKMDQSRIKDVIKKGLKYYFERKKYKGNGTILSDTDWESANQAINSIKNNTEIMEKLHPTDVFGYPSESHNEDAMFIDFYVICNDKATKLKFKMKIDNWTIDPESKKLVLNDLKTARDNPEYFASKTGHLETFNYYRQLAIYGDVLKYYCTKEYGYTPKSWAFETNFLVVRNNPPFNSKCCNMNDYYYNLGIEEYTKLLKMVGYYTIFGWDKEVEFV